jgi:hypothetical protein
MRRLLPAPLLPMLLPPLALLRLTLPLKLAPLRWMLQHQLLLPQQKLLLQQPHKHLLRTKHVND